MCLYPRIIKNRKYTSTIKNGGEIPPLKDERTKYVPIGCGNCIECRKQKARSWQVRLLEDIKTNNNGKFITLTFADEAIAALDKDIQDNSILGYDRDNKIATLAIHRFRERWRKEYSTSIRHWFVTELGHNGTENIHLHGIVWTDEPLQKVEKIWAYGYVWKGKKEKGKIINYVNEKTVTYITKYVNKIDEVHTKFKSKILTSPGIGGNYTTGRDWIKNQFNGENTQETYRTTTGHKMSLPIYFRNKIYTDDEKEQLWISKLNKETRYIRGEKVSIKHGYDNYDKLLKWHQERNIEMKYGTDEKDWTIEQYERERRIVMQKKRIEKGNKNNKKKERTGNAQ